MTGSWLEDYLRDDVSAAIDAGEKAFGPQLEITVHRMCGNLLVSEELLMDLGVIPDTRPPRKPPTRRERFRWWRSGLRDRFAIWLYERVSGDKFPDDPDY